MATSSGYLAVNVLKEKSKAAYDAALKAFAARGINALEVRMRNKDAVLLTVRHGDEIVGACVARPDVARLDMIALEELSVLDAHRVPAHVALLEELHRSGFFRFSRKPASDEEHEFLIKTMRFEAVGGPPDWPVEFRVS